jgi:hypothetical protein
MCYLYDLSVRMCMYVNTCMNKHVLVCVYTYFSMYVWSVRSVQYLCNYVIM